MDKLLKILDRHARLKLLTIVVLGVGAAASYSAAALLH